MIAKKYEKSFFEDQVQIMRKAIKNSEEREKFRKLRINCNIETGKYEFEADYERPVWVCPKVPKRKFKLALFLKSLLL